MVHDMTGWIVRTLLLAAAAIILLLGFLICADVIGRAVFNSPVKGTPEMVSMSIVIICFLLAGYAVHSGGMIYTDAVVARFGGGVLHVLVVEQAPHPVCGHGAGCPAPEDQ